MSVGHGVLSVPVSHPVVQALSGVLPCVGRAVVILLCPCGRIDRLAEPMLSLGRKVE